MVYSHTHAILLSGFISRWQPCRLRSGRHSEWPVHCW